MRTFMYIDGKYVKRIDCENIQEAEKVVGHGNIFMSRAEAEEVIALRNKEKVKTLTKDEIEAQNEWARSLMTEEDKRIAELNAKEMAYNVSQEQLKFAYSVLTEIDKQIARQTQREMNYKVDWEQFKYAMWKMGIRGEEFEQRKRAFWARYNREHKRYA